MASPASILASEVAIQLLQSRRAEDLGLNVLIVGYYWPIFFWYDFLLASEPIIWLSHVPESVRWE